MNRFASRVKSLVQTIVLVLIFVGCGGTPIDGFKGERGQVSGKITLGGEPVQAGCQVYLCPLARADISEREYSRMAVNTH